MAVFCSSRLDAYFLTIIAGIENTERVASDFSNELLNKPLDFDLQEKMWDVSLS